MEMSTDVKENGGEGLSKFCREYFLNLMSCITTNFKRRNYFRCLLPACISLSLSLALLHLAAGRNLGVLLSVTLYGKVFMCLPSFPSPFFSPFPVMQKLKFFGKVQALPKVFVLLTRALARSHSRLVDMLRRRICVATNLIC